MDFILIILKYNTEGPWEGVWGFAKLKKGKILGLISIHDTWDLGSLKQLLSDILILDEGLLKTVWFYTTGLYVLNILWEGAGGRGIERVCLVLKKEKISGIKPYTAHTVIQYCGAGAEKPKLDASRSRNYELRLRPQLRLRLVSIYQTSTNFIEKI